MLDNHKQYRGTLESLLKTRQILTKKRNVSGIVYEVF
jgi:hypothetical protein